MDKLQLNEIIWQIVSSIPRGKVATYGQIAKLAGFPSHARYVGTTLKNLPKGSKLPWYRVINAKGEISFSLNGDAYQRQRLLLESEGIVFNGSKIPLKHYLWQ
jgi:methylated-DNA-protein-cysteine methyltransferase-like protein